MPWPSGSSVRVLKGMMKAFSGIDMEVFRVEKGELSLDNDLVS
jgi:hypothetical protein